MTALARYDNVVDYYVTRFEVTDDPPSLALFDLLGPVAGLRVLDVACGHGRMTRELAARGAAVTGIDLSAALIARASDAELREPHGIRYIHADVTSAGWREGPEYDVVSCHFGLSDIDDLEHAIAAVASVLKPGGRFVFSILHPCFPGSGSEVSGSWPPDGRYYDEGFWTAGGALSPLRRQVGANHRTLSTYLTTLRRHGLWLDAVSEPDPGPTWTGERARAARHPVYLIARCLKAPASAPK